MLLYTLYSLSIPSNDILHLVLIKTLTVGFLGINIETDLSSRLLYFSEDFNSNIVRETFTTHLELLLANQLRANILVVSMTKNATFLIFYPHYITSII